MMIIPPFVLVKCASSQEVNMAGRHGEAPRDGGLFFFTQTLRGENEPLNPPVHWWDLHPRVRSRREAQVKSTFRKDLHHEVSAIMRYLENHICRVKVHKNTLS